MDKTRKILIIEKGLITSTCFDFLREQGFDVTSLNLNNPIRYHYGSRKDKLRNVFQRVVYGRKDYLETLDYQYHDRHHRYLLNNFLKTAPKFDVIIVIRPDIYSTKVLDLLKNATNAKLVGYMWDGISEKKHQQLLKVLPYYHKIFCFDHENIKQFPDLQLGFLTNFYYPNPYLELSNNKENAIEYLGGISNSRDQMIEKLISEISKFGRYQFNIKIMANTPMQNTEHIQYIYDYLPYEEHLKMMARSKISLDLSPDYHNGVSFRIFESLYFKTKMISTNTELEHYDFYHPNNILILKTEKDYGKIKDFLNQPYTEIDISIIEKYRVDRWLQTLLDC